MSRIRRGAPLGLAIIFIGSGAVHFFRPQFFGPIMPRVLPSRHHRAVIYASGAAELVCAVGLLNRTRWAPAASTAVLIGVLPANLQMAIDAGSGRNPGVSDKRIVAWGRLPLQIPLLWAARQARSGRVPLHEPSAGGS